MPRLAISRPGSLDVRIGLPEREGAITNPKWNEMTEAQKLEALSQDVLRLFEIANALAARINELAIAVGSRMNELAKAVEEQESHRSPKADISRKADMSQKAD